MTDIVEKVIRNLTDAQIRCLRAFPAQKLPVLSEALAAVGVLSRKAQPMPHGIVYETWELFVDVYAAYRLGSVCCEETVQRIEACLLLGAADHSVTELERGTLHYDAPSDCYRIRIKLRLLSYTEEEA